MAAAAPKYFIPLSAQDWARDAANGGGYGVLNYAPFEGMAEINVPKDAPVYAVATGVLSIEDGFVCITETAPGTGVVRQWRYKNISLTKAATKSVGETIMAGKQLGITTGNRLILGVIVPGVPSGDAVEWLKVASANGEVGFASGANELAKDIGATAAPSTDPTHDMTPIDPDLDSSPAAPPGLQISKRGLALGLAGVGIFGAIVGIAIAVSKKKKGRR